MTTIATIKNPDAAVTGEAPAPPGWQRISDLEQQVPGIRYRAVMLVQAPYPLSANLLMGGFRTQAAIRGDIRIIGFQTSRPLFDPRTGKQRPFEFIMEYEVVPQPDVVQQAGLDPRVILSLLALVVGSLAALALFDKHFEKAVQTVGGEVREVLGGGPGSVFNPATLAFVVLAIFLLTRGRS